MTKRIALSLLAIFLGGFFTIAASPSAFAHAALTSVNPEPGSTMTAAPKNVVFTFNENLKEPGFAAVSHDGRQLEDWTSEVQGQRLIVVPPEGETFDSGDYLVSFRVVSADGHPIKGSTDFVVQASESLPEPSSTESPILDNKENADDEEDSGSKGEAGGLRSLLTAPWLWGGIVMVVAIVVAAFVRSRNSTQSDDSTQ